MTTTAHVGQLVFQSPINLEFSSSPRLTQLANNTTSTMDIWIDAEGRGGVTWEVEELDISEGIGLWFSGNELTDYDGVFELPMQLIEYLQAQGYDMSYVTD